VQTSASSTVSMNGWTKAYDSVSSTLGRADLARDDHLDDALAVGVPAELVAQPQDVHTRFRSEGRKDRSRLTLMAWPRSRLPRAEAGP
jgi:hypothetical protein